jgi:hypothetical protein
MVEDDNPILKGSHDAFEGIDIEPSSVGGSAETPSSCFALIFEATSTPFILGNSSKPCETR